MFMSYVEIKLESTVLLAIIVLTYIVYCSQNVENIDLKIVQFLHQKNSCNLRISLEKKSTTDFFLFIIIIKKI